MLSASESFAIRFEAIKSAIDDWAECEMGTRDFLYDRGHETQLFQLLRVI